MNKDLITRYSKSEERLNIITHGLGLLLSIAGLPFLILKSLEFPGFWKPASLYIFGLSLIILYAASTFYHSATKDTLRRKLNIFDHAAIFVLIAGTYTPFTLIVLGGVIGWVLFGLTWGFALIGIVLKLFYTGKYDKLSTAMYVLMGWQIIFAIKPLMENLSSKGLKFLFLGGIFYTVGAVVYSIKRLPFNHATFHVFVVLGSLSHFFSVLFYI